MKTLTRYVGIVVLGACAAGCNLQGLGQTPRAEGPSAAEPERPAPAPPLKLDPDLNVQVLAFTAKWCRPSREMLPVLAKLRREYPAIAFREIDVDAKENRKLVAKYDPDGYPAFFILVDGRVCGTIEGAVTAEEFVESLRAAAEKAAAKPR